MPLFISDDEFRLIAHDAAAVAERADAFIRDVRRQLDSVRAEADAASIAAEQTSALLEQNYSRLYSDFKKLQFENGQLSASVELRLSEIADAKAEKHQLHLKAIVKDGEIERLSVESAELQKAKRQLLELVEHKDAEIQEKNTTIQSYLEKIVNLTEGSASKETKLQEIEAELGRCRAACRRVNQEKELLEKHNAWLNEELTTKVNSLVELRRTHMDVEADLSSKLADCERQLNESSNSLQWSKERVQELEKRVNYLEEELRSSKDTAATNEERFAAELSTVTKLVELYKSSSEEWSKKAGELEGVIKALETHLSQTENEYKDKLEREVSIRNALEKEAAELREKLEKCEIEIENTRKAGEFGLSNFHVEMNTSKLSIEEISSATINENSHTIVPRIPIGISGTALAASLLRDGWSLAKMYEKYQETHDALLHERAGRRYAETTLKKVFHEIEEKLEMISDERAEHERMVEAYTLMDQKLQQALLEHDNLDSTIRQLKAELKMRQREYGIAQKEINDLQRQVTILLKECQDVQLRCGGVVPVPAIHTSTEGPDLLNATDAEKVISEHLLAYKDIDGLVEQNVHLRRLAYSFKIEEEKRDAEITESFHSQLQKVSNEATAKVEAVLKRCEEQASMIESLHCSVAMYKRLYEEERKIRASSNACAGAISGDGKKEIMVLLEGSQEVSKKAHEQLSEHAKNLEHELATLRGELLSSRSERDKMLLEANFAKERLDSFMKEFDHQRREANAVSSRNVELTHLIIDYQRRLRESSDSLQTSEENSRKLSMEISILKHEKEILVNSEKRASDEVHSLSQRVYRLQSSLDTIQSAEEVRENARSSERRKLEDHLKRVELDWAEVKRELQEERDRVRALILDKEKIVENSVRQMEELRRELSDAWRAVASAESRAAVAEARCSDLEAIEKKKVIDKDSVLEQPMLSVSKANGELLIRKDELERLKEEAEANKEHMQQYKEIARTNELALKQMESVHEEYKLEAEKLKMTLEDEVESLRCKICELENTYRLKSEEAASASENREHALSAALAENLSLREESAQKTTHIEALELQVSSLKDDLDKEHRRWRTAQDNYERQVILQSETIQELTNTSKELSMLQSEISKLKALSETLKSENDLLKRSWENEKAELQELKNEAERKYGEVNEQNKLLHNRLEALHIQLADKEYSSTGHSSQNVESRGDNDVQNVISYLRRSKEIAETEISLLKQEKLRLQSQLESALKAFENAQALLHSQCENSRNQLYNEEEFKSLQLQVREINLLRESNIQLRAENKHNFEECQKFREEAKRASIEAEKLGILLREKEVELEARQKEVEEHNLDIENLNSKIKEFRESTKNLDAEEYERMNNELQQIKILLAERESEVQLTNSLVSEKQEVVLKLEQNIARYQLEIAEQGKRLDDAMQAEANAKAEIDRLRKINIPLKKKIDTLKNEKDELNCKNQALTKQIDDLKSSRKAISESSSEQAKKDQEKDTRIQILEKTVEKQRDEMKKENEIKSRRKQSRNAMIDLAMKIKEEKTKVEEELLKHKNSIVILLEQSGISASQLPSGSNLDEQVLAYFNSISKFEVHASSVLNDGDETQALTTESPNVDPSAASLSGCQVPSHPVQPLIPRAQAAEEREKPSTAAAASKPNTEMRKSVRRIIRPHLERSAEPSVDTDSGMEQSAAVAGEVKAGASHESELPPVPSARKRLASSEPREHSTTTAAQDEEASNDVVAPSYKKSKHSEDLKECTETHDAAEEQSTVPADMPETHLVHAEDAETDNAPVLSNDEGVDDSKAEDDVTTNQGETEEQQQKEPADVRQQEDEVQDEGDVMEDLSDKPDTATELVDEGARSEDVKELQPAESEDEREEGELMPDDIEQQEDEVTLGDAQHESFISDGGEAAEEVMDATDDASLPEGGEETNAGEEATESTDKQDGNNNDQDAPDSSRSPQRPTPIGNISQAAAAPDSAQSPQKSTAAREGSPVSIPHPSIRERRSLSPSPSSSTVATETDEPAQVRGRTINLKEIAEENAKKRRQSQPARTEAPAPRGGRGRLGSLRVTRGARGRGGRGPAFGDREQN